MLREVFIVALSLVSFSAAIAQGTHSQGAAFNAICVGSLLRSSMVQPLAEAYGSHFKLRVVPLPAENMKLVNPDNKFGFGIGGSSKDIIIVSYGEKSIPEFTSSNCTITSSNLRYDEAKNFVVDNFKVTKPHETGQAGSKIAIYMTDLVGFGTMKTAISIQTDATLGFTSITLMSMPPN